jgi:DNA invertase Pin-like site-specific DNA recombinase
MAEIAGTSNGRTKITAAHLKRDAFLYVRQSTLHQVLQNSESTQRQYALQQQAIALGWPMQRVHVIDSDLGHSGASSADRVGFQELVSEVGLEHAGVVLGLEVSRLARNSADWQRLLELCALTDTLILDEDGLYDCNDFNDRLLLGLKGTLSEAELHFLRARMRGGILNKARRGELACPLPIGLSYDELKRVRLDPDQQVQQSLRCLFETFQRVGTAHGMVIEFRRSGLQFPHRPHSGLHKGMLIWGDLTLSRALEVLHNPRYAGAFCFGRTHSRTWPDGSHHVRHLSSDEWGFLIPDAHAGYISWEEFQANQRRLLENAQAYGKDRRKSPAREGPALLQGLVICGVCGRRMTVRYHDQKGRLYPDYVCQRENVDQATPKCQHLAGKTIDAAVTQLILEKMNRLELEVSLAVQQEIVQREAEADALRTQQVVRAQYEADLAGQRYHRVDPNNRLVASTLEAEWNAALRKLQETQQNAEQYRQKDRRLVDESVRAEVLALSSDFPAVWNNANTTDQDRKRLVRLLIEDVTLTRSEDGVLAQVRFRGGKTQSLSLSAPLKSYQTWITQPEVVQEIDRLLDEHTDQQVADILNQRGLRAGKGGAFTKISIGHLRRSYQLRSYSERLRSAGMLTTPEIAQRLGVSCQTVKKWRYAGLMPGRVCNEKGDFLYEPPGEDAPRKHIHKQLSQKIELLKSKGVSQNTKEVQYES